MMFRPWETENMNTSAVLKTPEIPEKIVVKETKCPEPINLRSVLAYLKCQVYPSYIHSKNDKSNFRRQTKSFYLSDDVLYYKKNSVCVIFDEEQRKSILKMIHEGSEESIEAVALSSHRGRDATINMLNQRCYWPSITSDVKSFIKECDICQRVNPATLKIVPELHSIPIPKKVFKQIGIDLITLPEVNGFRYVAVAIDYFSKWCEARPLTDKKAVTVARFIYDEIICRHGCPKVEISDQGREFCNQLCEELFRMTGTSHRVTSPYHPQANGLVERFNRTIKNSLLKIHLENVLKWPDVLQGVLFAYRTVPHTSTKYSPFYVLYQREAVLPVDIQHNLEEDSVYDNVFIGDFDEEQFEKTLKCMLSMRDKLQDKVEENILDAQSAQRKSYAKRHPLAENTFKVGDKVLVKNLRRDDRKGGWASMPWLGPFTIHEIINNKICQLKNDVKVLKTKVLISNMKKYFESDGQKLNEDIYVEELKTSEKSIMSRKDIIPTGPKTRMFYPVGKTWQQTKCRTLKLNFSQQVTNEIILAKFLTVPSEIKNIVGDGNCLYRSLSYWITGDEDYHFAIRQHVCEIVKTSSNIERYIGGKENMKKYLEQKTIENDAVWGTDVEIFGAAILLKTSIYVYMTATSEWQLFNKDITMKKPIRKTEKCLYIRNFNNVHYDVVINVE